jgi:hypothetical protein
MEWNSALVPFVAFQISLAIIAFLGYSVFRLIDRREHAVAWIVFGLAGIIRFGLTAIFDRGALDVLSYAAALAAAGIVGFAILDLRRDKNGTCEN